MSWAAELSRQTKSPALLTLRPVPVSCRVSWVVSEGHGALKWCMFPLTAGPLGLVGEREAAEREDERWLVHRSSVSTSPSPDTWTNAEGRELRGRYDPGMGDRPEQVQASHISDRLKA